MSIETGNKPAIPFSWLPYAIGGCVFLLSILLCHCLLFSSSFPTVHTLVIKTLPWLVLGLGAALAIFLALTIRFAQLTRQRSKILETLSEHMKEEINERILVEESKQTLERTLLQGQKLQAIGTLAGGIAHDFNNILYAISGYVEMSRDDVEKDALVYKNLGKVLDATVRGKELVSRILSFSRRQSQDFKPVDLKTTIESALGLLRPTVPASVTLCFEAPTSCTILGNQTQLHQILVNVVNNAVDAMEGEGTIKIKLDMINPAHHLLKQIPDAAQGNYCKIDISDTGFGMDQGTVSRIFEPFYTTKEVGKGTGLGLATVHTIVKAHHGEILVKSKLGHGTTFSLLLPEYTEGNNNG